MERRLAAILAADVVGYTKLMAADEAGTLERLKAHREAHIDPTVAGNRGRIVKLMGDGALVEFASVVDAVTCAVEIQRGMAVRNENESEERRIRLRIGVNLGDVIIEGDDLYGDGVNVAARLEGLADPGGICLSAKVYEEVKRKLALGYEDIGDQQVKNLEEPVRVYRVSPHAPAAAPGAGRAAAPELSEKPSIAVLPFTNMSGDPEQEYLADGISEDLITALSKIRWFLVISRNTTFTYKGQAVEVLQVAKELGVRYVLEGSVRKAGKRVRITAQLIDANSDRHVWAERYDREMADIFELQDEMAQTIVAAVEPELGAVERARARAKPPGSLDAWQTYQRGLWHLWRFEREANAQAPLIMQEAYKLDPNFAPAYAFEAYSHYINVVMGWAADPKATLATALDAAERALALDERDSVAYFALGRVLMMQGRHDDSIAALKTALELNSSSAQAYHGLGFVLTLAGRHAEAKEMLDKAERLSPRDPLLWAFLVVHALAHVLSGDYEGALNWARKTMQVPRSTGYWAHAIQAAALAQLGRIEAAREALRIACEHKPDLTLSYLAKTLPTKDSGGLDPYLEGLRKAGLPETQAP